MNEFIKGLNKYYLCVLIVYSLNEINYLSYSSPYFILFTEAIGSRELGTRYVNKTSYNIICDCVVHYKQLSNAYSALCIYIGIFYLHIHTYVCT